jgi:hypothetical protein
MTTQTLYQITAIKRKGKRTLIVKKALAYLPPELWDMIYDFKDRLEYRERYSNIMPYIPRIRKIINQEKNYGSISILNTRRILEISRDFPPYLTASEFYAGWEVAYLHPGLAQARNSIKNHALLLDKVEDRNNDFQMGRFSEGYVGVMESNGKWVSRRLTPIY